MTDVAAHPSTVAGVQAMDDQHEILVDSLNAIGQQLTLGNSRARLRDQIKRLVEFTGMHFSCEESLLLRYGYPGIEKHRKAHRNLIDQINQIKLAVNRAECGQDAELEQVLNSVRGQYMDHVERLDREYSQWLNARGVY